MDKTLGKFKFLVQDWLTNELTLKLTRLETRYNFAVQICTISNRFEIKKLKLLSTNDRLQPESQSFKLKTLNLVHSLSKSNPNRWPALVKSRRKRSVLFLLVIFCDFLLILLDCNLFKKCSIRKNTYRLDPFLLLIILFQLLFRRLHSHGLQARTTIQAFV